MEGSSFSNDNGDAGPQRFIDSTGDRVQLVRSAAPTGRDGQTTNDVGPARGAQDKGSRQPRVVAHRECQLLQRAALRGQFEERSGGLVAREHYHVDVGNAETLFRLDQLVLSCGVLDRRLPSRRIRILREVAVDDVSRALVSGTCHSLAAHCRSGGPVLKRIYPRENSRHEPGKVGASPQFIPRPQLLERERSCGPSRGGSASLSAGAGPADGRGT